MQPSGFSLAQANIDFQRLAEQFGVICRFSLKLRTYWARDQLVLGTFSSRRMRAGRMVRIVT